jgi:predicted ATPase with chaperone activity
VQEARERVRAAVRNSGFEFPLRRGTVNLAPAERRNEGTGFELAIGQLRADVTALCLGELALDGALRPVRGTMPRVRHAATRGVAEVLIATANAVEAAACGMESFGFASLYEVVDHLRVGRALLRRRRLKRDGTRRALLDGAPLVQAGARWTQSTIGLLARAAEFSYLPITNMWPLFSV